MIYRLLALWLGPMSRHREQEGTGLVERAWMAASRHREQEGTGLVERAWMAASAGRARGRGRERPGAAGGDPGEAQMREGSR